MSLLFVWFLMAALLLGLALSITTEPSAGTLNRAIWWGLVLMWYCATGLTVLTLLLWLADWVLL